MSWTREHTFKVAAPPNELARERADDRLGALPHR